MQNINEYIEKKFKSTFQSTELFKKISDDFNIIDFSKHSSGWPMLTPRQYYGQRIHQTKFSAVPFYYLDFLLKRNPKTIYDLGCGWNIFKKYIPNIIGIGAEPPHSELFYADIHDFVDDDFVAGHQDYFDSIFSINALHFVPLTDFKALIQNFYSMISPNGTGWLAINIARMIEKDYDKFRDKDKDSLDVYVRHELTGLDIQFDVVDIDLTMLDEAMNGNIRLVMHKRSI